MRILFINSIFPNSIEPNKGNFIVKNIAAYPLEIDVRVVAPTPFFLNIKRKSGKISIPYHEVISIGNRLVKVHRPRFILLPRNILQPFVPLFEYLFIRRTIRRISKTWNPDIIHANFASPDGVAAALIAKELHIPLLVTEHQGTLEKFLAKPILKHLMLWAYSKAKRVICVSDFSANIIRKANLKLDNICVIPNGVDFSRFQLRCKKPCPRKLIYIGYLIPDKGVHILILALALLKAKGIDFSLSIIGNGICLADLQEQSKRLDLSGSVSFLGEKSALEVAALLPQHDIMVHPSFIESFGIVMVEALAAGLPVVSTFNGGAEDIICPEVGTLVEVNNAKALAEGIELVLDNWDSYQPEAIRDYAAARFAMETVAMKTIQVYKEVLS
ncbi:MAG: hypothetical protein CVU50_08740 [Candidatus Cloacimonetes bacterium HGW-Cloacimonetes-3]|jgi:glycosyltransferase involved in cell wall biosynthesis|nr:MAG: hypothetical protein CVU50_08740 [Candidatus Cloacimonetes bacterium HGW-Cloacimonetes-3]